MPQTTFVLKEPNSKDKTLIFLIFRFNGSKLKYSTGQKVLPKTWNPEKQRVKELRTSTEYESVNMLLDDLESDVNNTYRKMILERISPTPELLRSGLNQILKKESILSKDLAQFGETILKTSNKKEGTKKGIRQTIRNLKEFKEKTGKSLHFDSIDLEFYDQYLEFAESKGYSHNTIGSHIKNIKALMNEAFERNLTKNLSFKSKRFKKLEEDSQSIYLSNQELTSLGKLDLKNNPKLDRVRDLFLIGCNTGLRFSDLSQLNIVNIDKHKKVIKLKTQKTDENLIIPINSVVKKIFKKYDGHPPPPISNVKMNEYLKELSEKAELNTRIEVIGTKGGKREKIIFNKHELVTVHTARRSFATNAYLMNVPTISIMKLTGHRTEKSFMKYIKISQEENANKLLTHPFFN